jgi:putative transcriptional regulator
MFYIFTGMEKERRVYNKIKAFLALKRVKSKELAEHLEVSEQTVSKWCTNYGQPSIPELYKIAAFLRVGVCDLLEAVEARDL